MVIICQVVVAPVEVECCDGNYFVSLVEYNCSYVFDENSVLCESGEAVCSPGDFVIVLLAEPGDLSH